MPFSVPHVAVPCSPEAPPTMEVWWLALSLILTIVVSAPALSGRALRAFCVLNRRCSFARSLVSGDAGVLHVLCAVTALERKQAQWLCRSRALWVCGCLCSHYEDARERTALTTAVSALAISSTLFCVFLIPYVQLGAAALRCAALRAVDVMWCCCGVWLEWIFTPSLLR
jgi:hypothetical protein